METYKLTIESVKNGKVFHSDEKYVTTLIKPKTGIYRKLLTNPPITQRVVKVEKLAKGEIVPPQLK